jgi:hypothetical protein
MKARKHIDGEIACTQTVKHFHRMQANHNFAAKDGGTVASL